ncbi:MAG: DUF4149 domain-containing protein [Hormoscilla sp. GM7CHS1pb]|nr:DUF4149 domain-containing protein [Hormoscilla sp. GM7CHS1pb]
MTTISNLDLKSPKWQTIVLFTLGFWLSSCLVLDFVIMPSMYTAGMMSTPGFAIAGYSVFWLFNRIELLCAALALTGLLVLSITIQISPSKSCTAIILSVLLLAVALIDTYGLTPQMSAMGLDLNLFEPAEDLPAGMMQMQFGYWALELLKLVACGGILNLCYPGQMQES